MPLSRLNRRTFLRASGVAIGLPFLDAMLPATVAEEKQTVGQPRMVLIGQPLGIYGPNFFPEQAGRDYVPSRYLKLLEDHRDRFTVFSGMSHRYAAGHYAEVGLFTGVAPEFIRENDIKNGISLDQFAAASAIAELCIRFGHESETGTLYDAASLALEPARPPTAGRTGLDRRARSAIVPPPRSLSQPRFPAETTS